MEKKYKRTKRGKFEIVHAMLKAVKEHNGSANKTLIQHLAYIDWRCYKKYFDLVLNNGYISTCPDFPNRYEITDKGKELLEQLNKLELKL